MQLIFIIFFLNRATVDEMRNSAATTDNRGFSGGQSTLVNNAQPTSFTVPPAYDSNVWYHNYLRFDFLLKEMPFFLKKNYLKNKHYYLFLEF